MRHLKRTGTGAGAVLFGLGYISIMFFKKWAEVLTSDNRSAIELQEASSASAAAAPVPVSPAAPSPAAVLRPAAPTPNRRGPKIARDNY